MPITFPAPLRTPAPFAPRMGDLAMSVAIREIRKRQQARHDIASFYQVMRPTYTPADWQLDLIEHLEWARQTPNARLMIFAPPRHGKSEVVSRQLPAFLLGLDPTKEILCAAGTQGLADEFGLYVRNLLNSEQYRELFPDATIDRNSNAIAKMTMDAGGGYRGVGVGVQIVGRGADWLIIDDPYTSAETAFSSTQRASMEAWYRTEARTRLAPHGRIILMHQRWHPEDLAATLLRQQEEDPDADQWRVLSYPAISEAGYADAYDHRRDYDQELDPRRWSKKALRAIRAGLTDSDWLALYQQRPVNAEGGFFQADWIQYHDGVPQDLNWYIGVDFAATDDARNDRVALVPVGVSAAGNWYIPPDYVFEHLTSLDAARRLVALVKKYKPLYVATEKGVLDRVMRPILNDAMAKAQAFVSFRAITRSSGKHIIAAPLQARMQAKTVYFPRDRTTSEKVIPQFLDFIPEADNRVDDFIDALANFAQTATTMTAPAPPEAPEEISDEDADEAMWDRIMANGAPRSAAPFERFFGGSIGAAKR
jgi:hypothetical protein